MDPNRQNYFYGPVPGADPRQQTPVPSYPQLLPQQQPHQPQAPGSYHVHTPAIVEPQPQHQAQYPAGTQQQNVAWSHNPPPQMGSHPHAAVQRPQSYYHPQQAPPGNVSGYQTQATGQMYQNPQYPQQTNPQHQQAQHQQVQPQQAHPQQVQHQQVQHQQLQYRQAQHQQVQHQQVQHQQVQPQLVQPSNVPSPGSHLAQHYYPQSQNPPAQHPTPPVQQYNPASCSQPTSQPYIPPPTDPYRIGAPPPVLASGQPQFQQAPNASASPLPGLPYGQATPGNSPAVGFSGPPTAPRPSVSRLGSRLSSLIQSKVQGFRVPLASQTTPAAPASSQTASAGYPSAYSGIPVAAQNTSTPPGPQRASVVYPNAYMGQPVGAHNVLAAAPHSHRNSAVYPNAFPEQLAAGQNVSTATSSTQSSPMVHAASHVGQDATASERRQSVLQTTHSPGPVASYAPPLGYANASQPVGYNIRPQSVNMDALPAHQHSMPVNMANTANFDGPQPNTAGHDQLGSVPSGYNNPTPYLGPAGTPPTVQSIPGQAIPSMYSPPAHTPHPPNTISQQAGVPQPSTQYVQPSAQQVTNFSNVVSGMARMQVSGPIARKSVGTQHGLYDYDEPEILLTPMRATGSPDQVARMCTGDRVVDYERTWYHLPATPSFLICTWCYETHIRPTQFSSVFEQATKSQGRCRFSVPRITSALWPTAQRTGNIGSLQEYMSRRPDIADCKGKRGAVFTDHVKWFSLTRLEINDFAACEACYEDHILDSSFANHFQPSVNGQSQDATWACDIHYEYMKRSLKKLSRMTDVDSSWAKFISGAKRRVALPPCEGQVVTALSVKWYRPRQSVANLDFCEACFMDHVAMSPFERDMQEAVESFTAKLSMRVCDLNLISVREALSVCYNKRLGFGAFIDAAKVIAVSPRCSAAQGIIGGKWHDLEPVVSNFGVCEGCYAGILVPHGVSQFWKTTPIASTSGVEEFCAFNPRVPRFDTYVDRWSQAIETGVWAAYKNYIQRWAPILVCGKYEPVTNRVWYGWPECTFCQDCYESFAVNTALAESMPLQKALLAAKNMCCMYTARMRGLYTAACASGNPAELLAASRERLDVYQNTVPQMMMLKRKTARDKEIAKSKIALSFQYSSADTALDLISASSVKYGNSDIGYYSTMGGVEGAQMYNEGMATLGRAHDPSVAMQIARLETIWKGVE